MTTIDRSLLAAISGGADCSVTNRYAGNAALLTAEAFARGDAGNSLSRGQVQTVPPGRFMTASKHGVAEATCWSGESYEIVGGSRVNSRFGLQTR